MTPPWLICSRVGRLPIGRSLITCPTAVRHLAESLQRSVKLSWVAMILALAVLPLNAAIVSGKIEVASAQHSDIVVWLQPLRPIDSLTAPTAHVRLLQKDKMFHPHTLVISVGTVVDFPNKDPIFHNAFSTFDGQIFDVGLYPPSTNRSVVFRRAGVVRVFCNIHPSMSAVIVVVDTPYFAKAAPDGRYQIKDVPPGSYQLHVFDERATTGSDSQGLVTVDGGDAQTTAPPIHLSEAGYLRLPHKNKYGLDYPPSSSDEERYNGIPK
jgi:plastocyanin